MKITCKNQFWDGQQFEHSDHQLVANALALVENDIFTIIINLAARRVELKSTQSTSDSLGFDFSVDDEWQGSWQSFIEFHAETDQEIEWLKMQRFDQWCKEQIVFKFLPWIDTHCEEIIATFNVK